MNLFLERGGVMLTPTELVLTFESCYLCTIFDENQSRNKTVRVQTDRHMLSQRQTEFIICPVLYTIAMGQIKKPRCSEETVRCVHYPKGVSHTLIRLRLLF